MAMSTSQLQLQPTSPLSHDTNISKAGFRFLSLPAEIRLVVYNELLVQSDGLHRTFCICNFCANLKSRSVSRDHLNPSILRTNKAIYNETLPVLYSKNLFTFLCYGPFAYRGRLSVSKHRRGQPGIIARAVDDGLKTGPIANRHSPWAGVAKLITCPSDAAKLYVRRVFLELDWVYHTILDGFPTKWWQLVESDILFYFPGLDEAVVQIPLREMSVPAFYLVLQRKYLMTECRKNYKSILAHAASRLCPTAKARERLRNIEGVCNALVASHAQVEMKKCIFGVKLVNCTDIGLFGAGPEALKEMSTRIQLGCHENGRTIV